MKKVKEFNIKKCIIIISLIIFFVAVFYSFNHFNSDGMEQRGIKKISYQTYSNNHWSKWSKNGVTSGNLKSNFGIKKIKIKLGRLDKESINYSIYSSKGWSSDISMDKTVAFDNIYGIRLSATENIMKKYNICYRTYNKKNQWMEWSCNYDINGNINEKIIAIQIKIIPKNIILNEYLKDYNKNNNLKSTGF